MRLNESFILIQSYNHKEESERDTLRLRRNNKWCIQYVT